MQRASWYTSLLKRHYGWTDGRTDGPMDRRTYRQTDRHSYCCACTHLKWICFTFLLVTVQLGLARTWLVNHSPWVPPRTFPLSVALRSNRSKMNFNQAYAPLACHIPPKTRFCDFLLFRISASFWQIPSIIWIHPFIRLFRLSASAAFLFNLFGRYEQSQGGHWTNLSQNKLHERFCYDSFLFYKCI